MNIPREKARTEEMRKTSSFPRHAAEAERMQDSAFSRNFIKAVRKKGREW